MAQVVGFSAFDCIALFASGVKAAHRCVSVLRDAGIDPHEAMLIRGLRFPPDFIRLTFIQNNLLFCLDVPTSQGANTWRKQKPPRKPKSS